MLRYRFPLKGVNLLAVKISRKIFGSSLKEYFNIGGYRYRVEDFLKLKPSDRAAILRESGATNTQIQKAEDYFSRLSR